MRRPLVLLLLGFFSVTHLLASASLLRPTPRGHALPPAGVDVLVVTGEVSVTSLLGAETIPLTGSITIERGDPQMDGGTEVVAAEIVAMDLVGASITGPIAVVESTTLISSGEVRSLQPPPDQFPASSFFDVFISVTLPASPAPTVSRHNKVPLHLVPMSGGSEVSLSEWPPIGVKYEAAPDPCVPLVPILPQNICVTGLSIVLGGELPTPTATPIPTDTPTPGPTAVVTPSPTPVPTATPAPEPPMTFSVAADGPSGFPQAGLLGLAPGTSVLPPPPVAAVTVSGNDDFADAWIVPSLPFIGEQNTGGKSLESGEPDSHPACPVAAMSIGATVWYQFTPPADGTVNASTAGSSGGYDTAMAVYTGSAVDSLTLVTCDDDSGPGLRSEAIFPVVAGTTYSIQAGGFGASTGNLVLNVAFSGGAGQAAFVRFSCTELGLSTQGCAGGEGGKDDVDALSFGADSSAGDAPVVFSVAPGSAGLPDTAVAEQAACDPAQPQADTFSALLDGSNSLLFDGDGINTDCPTADSLGLVERPLSDDLDALNEQPPGFVDPEADGAIDEPVFFSLAAGSPTLDASIRGAADVLWTVAGFQPGIYASAEALGLQPDDDIDALCLINEGEFLYEPEVDAIAFSLAPGSPTLAALGASPADVLGPGPRVLFAAGDLGLREGDDLNAMTCFAEAISPLSTPTPTPTSTPTPTPTSTPSPTPTATLGSITGPSTGDEGLAGATSRSLGLLLAAAGLTGVAVLGWGLLRLRRR